MAAGVSGVDAEAAVGRISPGPGFLEPSLDVAAALSVPHDPAATRSIVLVADEEAQSLAGLYEWTAAALVKSFGVDVLTFSNSPETYDELGPVRHLTADIRAETVDFLRRRAGK